jgi:hypothetical protein
MKITIANRYRPFSHQPGTSILLPGTPFAFTIYPTRIEFINLITHSSTCRDLPIHGPVEQFTVFLDLEKHIILVQGKALNQFFRYTIAQTTKPNHSTAITLNWHQGESEILLSLSEEFALHSSELTERLHLGCDKKQDWDLIQRRNEMAEIYPHWFALGRTLECIEFPSANGEMVDLLSKESLPILFKAGFYGILTPQLNDRFHQGIIQSKGTGCPLAILRDGARLIRSLFITQEGKKISILPHTPPEFHCGRFTGLVLDGIGLLDMEWTKKMIRRMVVKINVDGVINFQFRQTKRMRIRRGERDHGEIISCDQPIQANAGERILFDRFEK